MDNGPKCYIVWFFSLSCLACIHCGSGQLGDNHYQLEEAFDEIVLDSSDVSRNRWWTTPKVTVCKDNLEALSVVPHQNEPCRHVYLGRIPTLGSYHLVGDIPYYHQCDYNETRLTGVETTPYVMCGWGCGLVDLHMAADFFYRLVDEPAPSIVDIITETECTWASCGWTMYSYYLLPRGLSKGLFGNGTQNGPITTNDIDLHLDSNRLVMTGMNLANYRNQSSQEEAGAHWVLVIGYTDTTEGQRYYILNDSLVKTQPTYANGQHNPNPAVNKIYGKKLLLSKERLDLALTGFGWAIGWE